MPEQPQPSLTQRFAGAAAWNTLLFPVQFVVGLVASVLLLRYLSLAQYGVLTLLTGLAATIGLLADLGIERSLPRFLPEVEQRAGRIGVARFLQQIVALKLTIIIICSTALLIASPLLVGYLTDKERASLHATEARVAQLQASGATPAELEPELQQRKAQSDVIVLIEGRGTLFLWAVVALVVFGALYDVGMQFLSAYFKQKAWNLVTAVVALLQPLLVTSFVLLEWGMSGVLLGMVITPIVAVALATWQMVQAARELPEGSATAPPDPTLSRRFGRFAGVSLVTQATNWFYDTAFVSFALTAMGISLERMALLAFAYTFAKSYLSYAYLPFGGLLTPLLTRIRARNDTAALHQTYGSLSRLFALILIPAGVGLALLTPWMLALLYPKYAADPDTALLAYLLIGFAFAESLLSVPHNVLMVYERYRPVLAARMLALVSLPLLAVLVPRYGLLGAATAVGAARLLPRLITLTYARRTLDLSYPLRFVGRVLLATLAFAGPLLLLMPLWPLPTDAIGLAGKISTAVSLAGAAALAAALYLVALRLLGGLDAHERERILSLKLPFKKALARLL